MPWRGDPTTEVIYMRVPPGTRARIAGLPSGEHPSAFARRHLLEQLNSAERRMEGRRRRKEAERAELRAAVLGAPDPVR